MMNADRINRVIPLISDNVTPPTILMMPVCTECGQVIMNPAGGIAIIPSRDRVKAEFRCSRCRPKDGSGWLYIGQVFRFDQRSVAEMLLQDAGLVM